jgi:hypothetical protein
MAVALGYQSRFAWPFGIISLQNEFNEFEELFSPSPILIEWPIDSTQQIN